MKLFGFEIKKTPATPVMKGKNFSSSYLRNDISVDGVSTAQGYATYWHMYRTNTDILRCIEEKIQTSMRKGFELQRVNVTDGKRKTATDEAFVKAL